MASVILPSADYEPVLQDPLGLGVLLHNRFYPNPNRFFSHWFLSQYFKTFPTVLQTFVDPIGSIYAAAAIAKIATQLSLVALLALYIGETTNIWSMDFLFSAALVCPFFITYKYYRLGIIDEATSFVFFYAIPCGLLLLFMLPLFRRLFHGRPIRRGPAVGFSMLILALVATLSGPVIPGFALSVCAVLMLALWCRAFATTPRVSTLRRMVLAVSGMPTDLLGYLIGLSAFCLYSLYIGRNDSENFADQVPLMQRYLLLLKGTTSVISTMNLLPPLVGDVALNLIVIVASFNNTTARKIATFAGLAVVWSVVYIALLPLGGYRAYRPLILSHDVMTPVTVTVVLMFGLSARFLIFHLRGTERSLFAIGLAMFLFMYLKEDKSTKGANACEMAALHRLAAAKERVVRLSSDCTVMSWELIRDYEDSELNAELLKYWEVTREKTLYYQG